jgi:threonine dehydratase
MPQGTPFTKIDRTEALGAKVVLRGDSLIDARRAAEGLAQERGLVSVHPYDDPAVIAGQGTIALEMLADGLKLDTLLVPVGGGGLISGIAVAAKAVSPDTEIIGVQSALYPRCTAYCTVKTRGRPPQRRLSPRGSRSRSPGG